MFVIDIPTAYLHINKYIFINLFNSCCSKTYNKK